MAEPFDSRFISTRRHATLAKWWRELNTFGWPSELGFVDNDHRDAAMQQIAAELGYRWICGRLPPKARKEK